MALSKEIKDKIIKDFGTSPHDVGSEGIKVGLLTARINELTEHLKQHPKDFLSKRGLLNMIGQRKNVLNYIKSTDSDLYNDITKRLSL